MVELTSVTKSTIFETQCRRLDALLQNLRFSEFAVTVCKVILSEDIAKEVVLFLTSEEVSPPLCLYGCSFQAALWIVVRVCGIGWVAERHKGDRPTYANLPDPGNQPLANGYECRDFCSMYITERS